MWTDLEGGFHSWGKIARRTRLRPFHGPFHGPFPQPVDSAVDNASEVSVTRTVAVPEGSAGAVATNHP